MARMQTIETNVYDEDHPVAYCDCCDRSRVLTQCWPMGIETWACDECRGETDKKDLSCRK